jgi:uncharacterized protein (TIGR01244 family)
MNPMRLLRAVLISMALSVVAALAQVSDPTAGLMNAAQPLPNITSAGQPDQASLEKLAEAGYVAVIDLRAENEDRGFDEKSAVESLGMNYISIPVSGAGGVSYDNAALLDQSLSGIDGPVLVHCASSNRVGALLSLREVLNGASTEEALDLGLAAGLTSLRPAVEALLEEQ